MNSIPATLEEANIRIMAYIEKLKASGYKESEAISEAMNAFRKIKHHYASPKGSKVGTCKICGYDILHLVDGYTACATGTSEVELWHTSCESVSVEPVSHEVRQCLT